MDPKDPISSQVCTPQVHSMQEIEGENSEQPLPPPLPRERVTWVAPFATVGVDHTDHMMYKDIMGQRRKLHICIFVCTKT